MQAQDPPDQPDPLLEQLSAHRFLAHLPRADYGSLLDPVRGAKAAMVIEREPGWVLLHAKSHYPPGIFRLPTGIVQEGESSAQAALRELHEEANLTTTEPPRRLFSLGYEVEGLGQDFVTDAFLITGLKGELRPNDLSEKISAWREAALSDLDLLAGEHQRLDGEWRGWGLFYSALHRAVSQVLCGAK